MDLLHEYDDDGSGSDVSWNGDVPDEVPLWCKGLHRLIVQVMGDNFLDGGEPEWWCSCDGEFAEAEEDRRELPRGSLTPLLRQPYQSDVPITEYTTCRNAKVEALLLGSGQKIGEWTAFTLLYAKPDGDKWRSLEVGQEVMVGAFPFDEAAVVARILRGTKPGSHGRTQHCYYALLKVGAAFQYAALQHVHSQGARPNIDLSMAWCEDSAFGGYPPTANQLANFKPKSVSAVAKAAAVYIKRLAAQEIAVGEGAAKKQRKPWSDRGLGKAVASDGGSDSGDEEYGTESDV